MSDRVSLKVIVIEADLPASQQLDLVEFIEQLKRAESGIDAANKTLAAVTGRRRVKKACSELRWRLLDYRMRRLEEQGLDELARAVRKERNAR